MTNRYAHLGLRILLFGILFFCRPVLAQIPQDHPYQVVLRDFLATLTVDDFEVSLEPVAYEDSFFTSLDQLHATWILLEDLGRKPTLSKTGLRVDASLFTLEEIDRDGEVYMRAGRNSGFIDPINTAWWAQWDYPGNLHFDAQPVKLRAFVSAVVDMMMADKDLEDFTTHRRSDYAGGYLTKYAYVYYVIKDALPVEVQDAYEIGLLKFFERIESYEPVGSGGTDMEAFQLAGLWYAAEAIDLDDLRNRAKARTLYVLENIMAADGHHHRHGKEGIDLSYEGINQHFLSWAALMYDDPAITAYANKSARLKAFQTLPEPTGHFFSPSHFNTGTVSGSANDQWFSYQRDVTMAMLSDEAKYLVWTGRVLPNGYHRGVPGESEMRADIEEALNARNTDWDDDQYWAWTQPSNKTPGVWRMEHWLNGLAAASMNYRAGFYSELAALESSDASLTAPPFSRDENFIEVFADAFLSARFGSYGAIVHTGSTVPDWASGIPGLSGGGLSAFWTKETGSVWLGRSKGAQNADADQWDGEQGWETWAVHAISGLNSQGQPFSTARHRLPAITTEVDGNQSATVTISGAIGQHDGGRSAPAGAINGEVGYERKITLDESGIVITSTITSDGSDGVTELWEMIPLFLSDAGQNVADAFIEFRSAGVWNEATTTTQTDVTAIRTTRFDESVIVRFEKPRRVRLASYRWSSTKVLSRIQNVMVDLLESPEAAIAMPEQTSVTYSIRPAAIYTAGDPSGDGEVSAYDAAAVLQHIIDFESLQAEAVEAADASGDGTVTAFDASLILQYIVGLIDCIPADESCVTQ